MLWAASVAIISVQCMYLCVHVRSICVFVCVCVCVCMCLCVCVVRVCVHEVKVYHRSCTFNGYSSLAI